MPSLAAQASPSFDPIPSNLRAAALDESKLSFLRMVGHELRTPLNSIIGFSEIISRELYGPLNEPRYKEHAEIVRDSGLKLLRLVNQVMEIARLETGAAHLDIQPEPPDPVINEAIKALLEEIRARKVRVSIETQPRTPLVMADARALRTILVNLLQNAVAASPEGGEVTVRVRPQEDEVAFEVIDHGQGVDPAQIPRLMRPFEQGEDALTRHSGGAGLGLPIVRLLCAAMDGRVRLRSQPGQGVVACVRLPAAPPELSPPA